MQSSTTSQATEKLDRPPIRLSQKHLDILENCPNYFQQIYLDKIPAIVPYEMQLKAQWGQRFHLLMQQRELGLDIDSLLTEDLEMKRSIDSLVEAIKDDRNYPKNTVKDAEHTRLLQIDNYLFTVVYDLLIVTPETAEIFDWKTYLQPENSQKLAKNWQTRLYLYVLTETSHYQPEQISFTYWFVKLPQKPQKITFQYNSDLHQQTDRDLKQILEKLDRWLTEYFDLNIPLPTCNNCQKNCPIDRNSKTKVDRSDNCLDIASIPEVCLDL